MAIWNLWFSPLSSITENLEKQENTNSKDLIGSAWCNALGSPASAGTIPGQDGIHPKVLKEVTRKYTI